MRKNYNQDVEAPDQSPRTGLVAAPKDRQGRPGALAPSGDAASGLPDRSPRHAHAAALAAATGPAAPAAPITASTAAAAFEIASDPCGHQHFSHRAPWLRAMVLGANDGLVSVAALMMGVGGGDDSLRVMQLAGVAGLVGGALSMACGEFISVSSQKDAEQADIEKEKQEQEKGEEARKKEFEELVAIYRGRGLSSSTAHQVARELTEHDVVRAHARDELGIDVDDLANPVQASVASAVAFTLGAAIPLLAGAFVRVPHARVASVVCATAGGLLLFGALGASLGGARVWRGAARVLIGGLMAMGASYGIGAAFAAVEGGALPAA